jgi:hypothetical protein
MEVVLLPQARSWFGQYGLGARHTMALEQSAVLELLETLKTAEDDNRVRLAPSRSIRR